MHHHHHRSPNSTEVHFIVYGRKFIHGPIEMNDYINTFAGRISPHKSAVFIDRQKIAEVEAGRTFPSIQSIPNMV